MSIFLRSIIQSVLVLLFLTLILIIGGRKSGQLLKKLAVKLSCPNFIVFRETAVSKHRRLSSAKILIDELSFGTNQLSSIPRKR